MRKKRIITLLLAMTYGATVVAETAIAATSTTNEIGNLAGHLRQGGEVAAQGDWIYYRNDDEGGKLFRKKTDGTGKKKLSDDDVSQLNVVGDWVYYTSDRRKDEGRVYRLNAVTNQLQPLTPSDVGGMQPYEIGGSNLYFGQYNTVYRMGMDGSGKKAMDWRTYELYRALRKSGSLSRFDELAKHSRLLTILNESVTRDIRFAGNELIYNKANAIYRYDLATDKESRLTPEGHPAADLYVQAPYVYYSFSSGVERVLMSGGPPERVGGGMNQIIRITDEYIYYVSSYDGWVQRKKLGSTSDEDGERLFRFSADQDVQAIWTESAIFAAESDTGYLYRLDFANSAVTRLNADVTKNMTLAGGKIYYSNYSDGGKLYEIGLDGNGRKKRTELEAANVRVSGEWIYFQNESDMRMIYKVKTDGSGRIRVADRSAQTLLAVGGALYFQDENRGYDLYRIDPNGKLARNVITNLYGQNYDMDARSGSFYYTNDGKDLRSVRMDGSQDGSLFAPLSARFPVESDGWIYYVNPDQHQEIFKKRVGTNETERIMPNVPVWRFAIVDNGIYYLNYGGDDEFLHYFDTSTKETKTLIAVPIMDFAVDHDRIYYIEKKNEAIHDFGIISLKDSSGTLMSADLLGGTVKTLSDDTYDTVAGVKNGFILVSFYDMASKKSTTSRIPTQGGAARLILSDGACGPYNCRITDDAIYYEDADKHLRKANLDGSGSREIISVSIYGFDILDGYLYYGDGDHKTFNRSDLNGGQRSVLQESANVSEVQAMEGRLLIAAINDDAPFRKLLDYSPSSGQLEKTYSESNVRGVTATDKALYWIQDRNLMTSDMNGRNRKVAIREFQYQNFIVADGWIVYFDVSNDSLNKVRLDGTGKTRIISGARYLESWYVFGNYVYYYEYDGVWKITLKRMRLDGKQIQIFQ